MSIPGHIYFSPSSAYIKILVAIDSWLAVRALLWKYSSNFFCLIFLVMETRLKHESNTVCVQICYWCVKWTSVSWDLKCGNLC